MWRPFFKWPLNHYGTKYKKGNIYYLDDLKPCCQDYTPKYASFTLAVALTDLGLMITLHIKSDYRIFANTVTSLFMSLRKQKENRLPFYFIHVYDLLKLTLTHVPTSEFKRACTHKCTHTHARTRTRSHTNKHTRARTHALTHA